MVNLLPKTFLTRLRRGYLLRLGVVALFLLLAALIISILLLVPPYVSIQVRIGELTNELATIEETLAREDAQESDAFLDETRRRLAALAAIRNEHYLYEDLDAVLAHKPAGVRITTLSIEGSGGGREILVRGVGDVRESVVTFERLLEEDERFTSVELPISELASRTDIDFTMTIKKATPEEAASS